MTSRNSNFPEQNKTIDLLNLLRTTNEKQETKKPKHKQETVVKKEATKIVKIEEPVVEKEIEPEYVNVVSEELSVVEELPIVVDDKPVTVDVEQEIRKEPDEQEVVAKEPVKTEITEIKKHTVELKQSRNIVYCRLTGHLGNNMFQIAAARFYASLHDMEVKFFFIDAYKKDKDDFEKTNLQSILREPIVIISQDQLISDIGEYYSANEESSIIYKEIPFEENKDLILIGNRQSEKYFNKDFALKLLNLDGISKEVNRLYGYLGNTCAIHIKKKNQMSQNTIIESDVRLIRQKFQDDDFIIFSDDIEWCKYRFSDLNFRFADKTSNTYSPALIDMVAMSKCMCVVMSNSTFSWWSAYLSCRPGHITVYKNPWTSSTDKNGDIIPDDNSWITLEQFLSL